ncbi:MAG TPA: hypothetical protein DD001_14265 [Microcoleaceae bacterium UBA10368]|nr:hypothetical protein [Microcoleaceae cyanobacterium UBA10368]HCV32135.1 hypothetical protein [Microcoleaceae cyanobacterium UBA9251]
MQVKLKHFDKNSLTYSKILCSLALLRLQQLLMIQKFNLKFFYGDSLIKADFLFLNKTQYTKHIAVR